MYLMNKNMIFTVLGAILVIVLGIFLIRGVSGEDNWICQNGAWVKHGNPRGAMPTGSCTDGQQANPTVSAEENTSMVNPASKNCQDKGGTLEIVNETAGQIGICKFSDGTQCEEWKFFRNECQKGQTKQADLSHSYLGVLTKTGSKYTFKSNGVVYQLQIPANASKDLTERLAAEIKNKGEVTILAAEIPALSKILVLKGFIEK